MKGTRITIDGDSVQRVGYRLFLAQQALLTGIEHFYAFNIDEKKVLVLLNSDQQKVDRFYEIINKEKPSGVVPKNIAKEPYEGDVDVPSIDRYLSLLSVDQLIQGRDGIVALGTEMKEVKEGVREVKEGVKEVKGGIDNLPDKIVDSFVNRLKNNE